MQTETIALAILIAGVVGADDRVFLRAARKRLCGAGLGVFIGEQADRCDEQDATQAQDELRVAVVGFFAGGHG